MILKFQNLSLVFHLCGLLVYDDIVGMFYVNLHMSPDSGELETLVLGTRIILNDFIFEKIFDRKFFGAITFMTGPCSDEFEVTFEEAKKIVSDSESAFTSNFYPIYLFFQVSYSISYH